MKNILIGREYYRLNRGYGLSVEKGKTFSKEVAASGVTYFNFKTAEKEFGSPGTFSAREQDIFDTKDEALAQLHVENKAKKDKLKTEVTNVQELFEFMFNHDISGDAEYGDQQAREVAIEKMNHFGFDTSNID